MRTMRFTTPESVQIWCGEGALADWAGEVLDYRRVLVVTSRAAGRTKGFEKLLSLLADRVAAQFHGSIPGVPERVLDELEALASQARPDLVVAFGGASSIDTAKAAIVRLAAGRSEALPLACIPSTLGGAEFTDFAGVTIDGEKVAVRDVRMRSRWVVQTPEVLLETPQRLLRESIGNAVAHALEGLLSPGATPVTDALYLRSIGVLVDSPRWDEGVERFSRLQLGAALAAMHSVPMGRAHAIVHTVVEVAGSRHGATHSIVSVHALRVAARVHEDAREALRGIAEAVRVDPDGEAQVLADRIAVKLWEFFDSLGVPSSLVELGVAGARFDEIMARLGERGHGDRHAESVLRLAWTGDRDLKPGE